MIYTITFAPSLDYVINSENDFTSKGLNRISDYSLLPGGKGINASVILKRLGFDNTAIIFSNGDIGSKIVNLIQKEKINVKNFATDSETRINVKYLSTNAEFEINGPRPVISANTKNEFIEYIKEINENDFVFIMGISDIELIKQILTIFNFKNVKFGLDVDSEKINELLKFKPYIYKPNIFEAKNIVNKEISTNKEILETLIELKNKGIQIPIISAGKDGSYYLNENNKLLKSTIINPIKVVSAVGAGDTLISSIYAFKNKNMNMKDVILNATAMSMATVSCKWLGQYEDIKNHINNIMVEQIEC